MAKDDMHVRFTATFNFTPPENRLATTRYPAGFEGSVRRVCGEAAIAAGKAVEIPTPGKAGDPPAQDPPADAAKAGGKPAEAGAGKP